MRNYQNVMESVQRKEKLKNYNELNEHCSVAFQEAFVELLDVEIPTITMSRGIEKEYEAIKLRSEMIDEIHTKLP